MERTHAMPVNIAAIALVLIAPLMRGQSRVSDEIIVTIPAGVQVGEHPLPPGEYRIRQIPSANNPRILEFVSEDKTVQATVAAVPALNNTGAETTVLELKRAGGRQYISRLWIEGKAYGYELPTPEAGSASTGASLQASYTPAPRPVEAAAAPAPEPVPARAEAPPAPAPQPEPPPAPQPEPVREPPPVEVPKPAEPPAMPETADGSIAGFLMSGSLLLLSGALLRPKPTS